MRILALDTATALTAVALRDLDLDLDLDTGTETDLDLGTDANASLRETLDLSARDEPPPGGRPGHAQKLLGLIEQLFDQGRTGWDAVDRIAVGVGPGTFTGLRIGIATAQALARATGTPLVGVSTLQALALAARDREPERAVLAVIDARRGEAFVAGWPVANGPRGQMTTSARGGLVLAAPALKPSVLRPEQLARVAAGSGTATLAVGDGALKFREALEDAGVSVPPQDSPLHRVSAREHCRIAAVTAPAPGGTVEPEYLRLPDAVITANQAAALR